MTATTTTSQQLCPSGKAPGVPCAGTKYDRAGNPSLRSSGPPKGMEVRDYPHGIFGSCTRHPRGLTRWAELLARRRRRRCRRQLVSPGGYRSPDPPPCLFSKGAGPQNFRSHTRMLGPSVYPAYLARGRVIRMLGPIPECLVLQYTLLIQQGGGSSDC